MPAFQGPTSPILKHVLVRPPHPMPSETVTWSYVARATTNSPSWTSLTQATTSALIEAAAKAIVSTPLQAFAGRYAAVTSDTWQEVGEILSSQGIDAASRYISGKNLTDLYTVANMGTTQDFIQALWDRIAAFLILRDNSGELAILFAQLKLMHLIRYLSSSPSPTLPNAFHPEILIPSDILGFCRLSTKDDQEQKRAARSDTIEEINAATKAKLKDLLLCRAAYMLVSQAVSDHSIRAVNPPIGQMEQPIAGSAPSSVKIGFDVRNFKVVLTAAAQAAVPLPVAQYLNQSFGIANLSDVDVISLVNLLHSSLKRKQSALFGKTSANIVAEATHHISDVAREIGSGRAPNIDEAIAYVANLYPLGSASLFVLPGTLPGASGRIRPAGVADLKVVNQQLQKYQLGEVAYIENILSGEERERVHTNIEKTEQQLITETEETASTEKDLQTAERFELSQELENMEKETSANEAGVNVSASYGAVSLNASAKTQSTNSAESATKASLNQTKETVSRAVERIQNRTRRQQTITHTSETSEVNRHKFSATQQSVVGVYRYVEKVYWCQTLNYGKRMMFEFMVPEPAAYFIYSQSQNVSAPGTVPKPEEPTFKATDIDDTNYADLASKYKANVTEPPKEAIFGSFYYYGKKAHDAGSTQAYEVPKDYKVSSFYAVPFYIYTQGQARPPSLIALFGSERWDSDSNWPYFQQLTPEVEGSFSISVYPFYIDGDWGIGVTLLLSRTSEALQRWQLATYEAIMEAYRSQKETYDRSVSEQNAGHPQVQLKADSDYRSTEQVELKRGCLELLTDQHFDSFGAIDILNNVPTQNNGRALSEGPVIEFFEQAFEWNEMTYIFYPYFWGRKSEWLSRISIKDADPIFGKFLQSGYARVVVPVRRTLENDIAYYMKTGVIWGNSHSGDAPMPEDPDYVPIVQEIKEMDDSLSSTSEDGLPEGAPWQIAVPTPLVCLDSDSVKLPSWDLPPPGKQIPYVPSEATCFGIPYNVAEWPDSKAIVGGLKQLGYAIPDGVDFDRYLVSAEGHRTAEAFQRKANEQGVSSVLGHSLRVDGIIARARFEHFRRWLNDFFERSGRVQA